MFLNAFNLKLNQEEWKSVHFADKQKLFKIHNFLFMSKGRAYAIEVQESFDNDFLAHGENTSDPHDALKSIHSNSIAECLQTMIQQIENKEENSYELRAKS